jgi:TolA-binding protein
MRVDLHPEELLERERTGTLGGGERQRLDEHARSCVACAFERRASSGFSELFEPFAGDDALVAKLVDSVTSPTPAHSSPLRRASLAPAGRGRTRWIALAAAAVLAAGLAAAAYSIVASSKRSAPPDAQPTAAPAPAPAPTLPAKLGAGTESETAIAPAPETPASAQPPIPTAPSASGAPAAETTLDARELFARGNKARRAASYPEAVRLYGELQRRFPGSREAHASRVALGGLMLNQLGNPAGALAQFDGYLRGGGVMSEEASAGRALALQRLGRTSEERRAWQELLARHPGSIHAERARERLKKLE